MSRMGGWYQTSKPPNSAQSGNSPSTGFSDSMAKAKSSEARAHHFAPQCWLAGFTDIGEKTGRLWVTDLKRKKQWASTPQNAGHRRDFYRASDPGLDPLTFEKQFSKIES